MPWDAALRVWDALIEAGRTFDLHPTGMLALDVARIEAGLLLIDVDFYSSRKAMIEPQKYSPFELGLGRLVDLSKGRLSVAQRFLPSSAAAPRGRSSASKSIGRRSSGCTTSSGLPPTAPATASRVHVPVYKDGRQVGRATSTTWSTMLKKLIALGDDRPAARCPRHAARHRGHGRSRPTSRRRDGGEDAVFQSATQDRDAARLARHHGLRLTAWYGLRLYGLRLTADGATGDGAWDIRVIHRHS